MQEFCPNNCSRKIAKFGEGFFLHFLHCSCTLFFLVFSLVFLESAESAENINKVVLVGKKEKKEKNLLRENVLGKTCTSALFASQRNFASVLFVEGGCVGCLGLVDSLSPNTFLSARGLGPALLHTYRKYTAQLRLGDARTFSSQRNNTISPRKSRVRRLAEQSQHTLPRLSHVERQRPTF